MSSPINKKLRLCLFHWHCDKVTVNADQQLYRVRADTRPIFNTYP